MDQNDLHSIAKRPQTDSSLEVDSFFLSIAYGPYAEKSAIRFQKWINFLFDWRGSVGDLKKQNYQ